MVFRHRSCVAVAILLAIGRIGCDAQPQPDFGTLGADSGSTPTISSAAAPAPDTPAPAIAGAAAISALGVDGTSVTDQSEQDASNGGRYLIPDGQTFFDTILQHPDPSIVSAISFGQRATNPGFVARLQIYDSPSSSGGYYISLVCTVCATATLSACARRQLQPLIDACTHVSVRRPRARS